MMGGLFDGIFVGMMGMMSFFGEMMSTFLGPMFEAMRQFFDSMMV